MKLVRLIAMSAVVLLGIGALSACQPAGTNVAGPKPVQVAVSDYHGCSLMADSTVRCWGSNRNGQLGNGVATGNNTTISKAVTVSGLANATQVTVGRYVSCAVRSTGRVACWGLGSNGRLGNGTDTSSSVPVTVSGITDAVAVSASNASAWPTVCALLSTGKVKCWGTNLYGTLGVPASTVPTTTAGSTNVPVEVVGVSDATALSFGNSVACVTHANETVSCWGRNLTNVFTDPSLPPATIDGARLPTPIPGLTGVTSISAGEGNICAMSGGTAKCWGQWDGATPVAVDHGLGFGQVHGTYGACGITASQQAYCYGFNGYRQIGDPAIASGSSIDIGSAKVLNPTQVKGLPAKVTSLGGSQKAMCAVLENGQIWCWGYNANGSAGTGTATKTAPYGVDPVRVADI